MGWINNKLTRRNRGAFRRLSGLQLAVLSMKLKGARRVKGRDVLLQEMPKGGVGVEIGVWRGDFSQRLLDALEPKKLYLVDPWPAPEGDARMYPRNATGQMMGIDGHIVADSEGADQLYQDVKARFAEDTRVVLMRATSLEAAPQIPDGSLDWVYLDGAHYYDNVREDLEAWAPKVKENGVICGDDYYWKDDKGLHSVKRAVDEWVRRHKPDDWFAFGGQYFIRRRASCRN